MMRQFGGWPVLLLLWLLAVIVGLSTRPLLPVDELRKWTWLWEAKLGGIEVGSRDVTVSHARPALSGPEKLPGLYPY